MTFQRNLFMKIILLKRSKEILTIIIKENKSKEISFQDIPNLKSSFNKIKKEDLKKQKEIIVRLFLNIIFKKKKSILNYKGKVCQVFITIKMKVDIKNKNF